MWDMVGIPGLQWKGPLSKVRFSVSVEQLIHKIFIIKKPIFLIRQFTENQTKKLLYWQTE